MNGLIGNDAVCLICLNDEFSRYRDRVCKEYINLYSEHGMSYDFTCSICGYYEILGVAYYQFPRDPYVYGRNVRAAVSHKFKTNTMLNQRNIIEGNSKIYDHFRYTRIPEIMYQINKTIEYVGETRQYTGLPLPRFPVDFHSIIGSISRDAALSIVRQLIREQLIYCENIVYGTENEPGGCYLTINGMNVYRSMLGLANVEHLTIPPSNNSEHNLGALSQLTPSNNSEHNLGAISQLTRSPNQNDTAG